MAAVSSISAVIGSVPSGPGACVFASSKTEASLSKICLALIALRGEGTWRFATLTDYRSCIHSRLSANRIAPFQTYTRRVAAQSLLPLSSPHPSMLAWVAPCCARITNSAASRHWVWSWATCVRFTISAMNCGPNGSVRLLQSIYRALLHPP